jgi:hypothetical protein
MRYRIKPAEFFLCALSILPSSIGRKISAQEELKPSERLHLPKEEIWAVVESHAGYAAKKGRVREGEGVIV